MANKVDIIVSCFNEEDNIFAFFMDAKKYLKGKYEYRIVYINDGSVDKTYEKVLELKKKNKTKIKISCISFIHNFGHEAAMCAGLDYSKADYMIFMDVDLQNPPKKIPEIMKKFGDGADSVLLRKVKYKSASLLKKITSNGYYLFSKIVLRNSNAQNVSDFFAIDKVVAKKIKDNYKTTLRFIRSFIQHEAKNIKFINYSTDERNAGVSRYNYFKLTKLALISELSRIKALRDKYKVTKNNPIYIIDKKKSF